MQSMLSFLFDVIIWWCLNGFLWFSVREGTARPTGLSEEPTSSDGVNWNVVGYMDGFGQSQVC